MRVSSWQGVLLSWANALNISKEPINDVLDLVKGNFFVKLLNKIKNDDGDIDENISEGDVYKIIEDLFKDQYAGFRLLGYWDNDEVTLVSSVLLLWASLQSQDFRAPLFRLNNIIQLKIHAFLEQFVETPPHHINRQIVMEAVLDIPSDDETEDECSSYISSPRTYSTPKRTSQYSPGFLALSEVRSLRGKVELLSCEKQHLQDELDLTKSQLKETTAKLEHHKNECHRLTNLLSSRDQDKNFYPVKKDDSFQKNIDETTSLKLELNELKEIHGRLRNELESTVEDNNNLSKKLKSEEIKRINAEHQCIEMESKVVSLSKRVEELEGLASFLEKTCEEQRNILQERKNISLEESFQYSESETLSSIIDIKYSELQEQLKVQTEKLEEQSKEIKKLENEKTNHEIQIKKLTEEVNNLNLLPTLSEKVSHCNECYNTKEKFAALQNDFSDKCTDFKKLQERLDQKINQLKIVTCSKIKDESHIAELKSNMSIIISDHNVKYNELKEEIVSLKCDLCEKNNSIEYFKDETDFLNTCLNEKVSELKHLESDYNEINSSKDREIAQLMITVEHLNREVRRLEDQLQGQYFKNEKLVQSAFQWRQKLTLGNTANEELARELISLHETLEWKNLKLKEFSLQVEQFKSELADKGTINKELQERLSFLTERNKEFHKELKDSKNAIMQLQSKIVALEFSEKKLDQYNIKNVRKIALLDTELRELKQVLHEKFIQIDLDLESHILKGNFGTQSLLEFVDFIMDTLKKNKKRIEILSRVVTGLESDYAENSLTQDKCKVELPASDDEIKSTELSKNENEYLKDKLLKIENESENNKVKLQISLKKLEIANEDSIEKDTIILNLRTEIEKLNKEVVEKTDLVQHLQQNVNLYEHEKNILEKKLKNLSHQTGKAESVKVENLVLKNDVVALEKQLEEERENLKIAEEHMNREEELNNAFDEKFFVLKEKMKNKYEEEINLLVEEYTKKIDYLKAKIKKDCIHIEQLSSDLWETSDRLVLAQQESEALRSQLRRTRQKLSDNQLQKRGMEDSHSFMWLGGLEADGFVDEMVTTVMTKRTIHQTPKFSDEADDEDFNQQCLEDLKAGICRIPTERLSCPSASTSFNEDTESRILAPPEKPRKVKGTITYRKPGPPTPSINAARHSLPGTEKLDVKRGLREHNPNTGQVRNRLSQLFGSIHLSKAKRVQESPKVKRKGFFQRTFGNRENIPPN